MTIHLSREIEKLKERLLALSTIVEEAVHLAVRAVLQRDAELAVKVTDGDSHIDQLEVEVEEDCLKILALHQPVAIDLRFIIACLKINNDLERIGDLAVNIASRAKSLAPLEFTLGTFDLATISRLTVTMLKQSLDSLINMNVTLARELSGMDDEVDNLNRSMFTEAERLIRADVENTEIAILLLSVSRNLERIADLATNIAEDVIYMIEGEIVRHQGPLPKDK